MSCTELSQHNDEMGEQKGFAIQQTNKVTLSTVKRAWATETDDNYVTLKHGNDSGSCFLLVFLLKLRSSS